MSANSPMVKEFIIPLERYPYVNENQTVHDAIRVVQSFTCGENDRIRYSELLVLNDQNKLVGHINICAILQCLDPRLGEGAKAKQFEGKGADFPNLAILWEDTFFEGCGRRAGKPIKECMLPIKHLVRGEDPLLKALAIMINTGEVLLPVTDANRIIGVIRLEEIFEGITAGCQLDA